MARPSVLACEAIVYELQDWIERRNDIGMLPMAWCTFSARSTEVGVGPFTLWDTENGYSNGSENDELTVEGCLGALTDSIDELKPFCKRRRSER